MILFTKTKEHQTQDLSFFKDVRKDNFFVDRYIAVEVGTKKNGKKNQTIKVPKKEKFKLKKKLIEISFEEKEEIIKELNKSLPLMMFAGIREQKTELLGYINKERRKKNYKLISIHEANAPYRNKKTVLEDGNYYFSEILNEQ